MRCCGNCEWSISSLGEEEIMIENEYDVDDCLLSVDHNGNYVCREHDYIENGISNYLLYDDTYLGPGYFIVTEYNGEIVKFIKLYQTGDGFPSFAIRGYDFDLRDRKYISFSLNKDNTNNDKLLEAINSFILRIYTLGLSSKFEIHSDSDTTFISLPYDNRDGNNCVDIFLGDYNSSSIYKDIALLYRDLAWISYNKTDADVMKRILKNSK